MFKNKISMNISKILLSFFAVYSLSACDQSAEKSESPSPAVAQARDSIKNSPTSPTSPVWRNLTQDSFFSEFNSLSRKYDVELDIARIHHGEHGYFIARPASQFLKSNANLLSVTVQVNSDDHVFKINISGSKLDPENQENFNTAVRIVSAILNPSKSTANSEKLLSKLGLAPPFLEDPIGKPYTVVENENQFICLYKPKNGQKGVVCIVTSIR
ncbi:hypothetical protein [Paraburkholderia sacchari]|uniref:hypothetical protein n=1 Tax=Paraburkholderia sacchari TaxID=159450 RepID=UPI003D95F0C6